MFRGFVVGFVVGTIIGLLTAPLSGERSRRIIREEIQKFFEAKRYITFKENDLFPFCNFTGNSILYRDTRYHNTSFLKDRACAERARVSRT